MKSFGRMAIALTVLGVASTPLVAAVAPAGATLSKDAAKAIASRMRAGVVMKLGKRVTRKNVELAQFGNAAPTGGWNVVPPAPAPTAVGGIGGAGAGAGAAGAGAAGAVGAGAGGLAGLSTTALVAGSVVSVGAVAGVAVAASNSSGSPIVSVSP